VLDNPVFASRIDSAMKLSNITGAVGSRKEAWFFVYADSTAPDGIRFDFPSIAGSQECNSLITAPVDLSIIAVVHTHPHYKRENMELACGIKGAGKYDPDGNGGGSDRDWAWQRQYGLDVYAVSPQVAHLLPRGSTSVQERNPYRWKKTVNGCWR